jgi:uncharacterized membrane protein
MPTHGSSHSVSAGFSRVVRATITAGKIVAGEIAATKIMDLNFLWWLMLFFSATIAVYGATYFLAIPNDPHFAHYIFPLRLHIAGGMGALLAGPWQFSQKLRARALNLHRWLGRFYLLEVALGSLAGLWMATVSLQGLPTHFGFGILAVLWFFTGLQAYRMARLGKHRSPPPVDDPQFRSHSRCGHASHLHASHARGSALAFSAHLYHGFLVVVGSKSTGRRVDDSRVAADANQKHTTLDARCEMRASATVKY